MQTVSSCEVSSRLRISALALLLSMQTVSAQERIALSGPERVAANHLFNQQASQKMGLLIPLYIYPANIHTNADYNRVMELKRQYSEVPFWVILNPASGPGTEVDANYTKAVDRLIGSGCVVLGYVPTDYGKIPEKDVQRHLDAWRRMYPRVHGIFYDEMIYEDTAAAVDHHRRDPWLRWLRNRGRHWHWRRWIRMMRKTTGTPISTQLSHR